MIKSLVVTVLQGGGDFPLPDTEIAEEMSELSQSSEEEKVTSKKRKKLQKRKKVK